MQNAKDIRHHKNYVRVDRFINNLTVVTKAPSTERERERERETCYELLFREVSSIQVCLIEEFNKSSLECRLTLSAGCSTDQTSVSLFMMISAV